MIELTFLIMFAFPVLVMVVNIILLIQQRKLLRQIRKLAALYPPYPVSKDAEDQSGATSVHFEEQWNDDKEGRD